MNKGILMGFVVAIVFGGGGFYAGMQYQAGQTPACGTGAAFVGRTGGAGGRFGGAGGGFTAGTILSKDTSSITIQLMTGTTTGTTGSGSKIILVDNNTMISKTDTGTLSDLAVGKTVTVSGTANSDGSITATMIQLRPAGLGRKPGNPSEQ